MQRSPYRHRSAPVTGRVQHRRLVRRAFTLVELLMVILIIGILVAMLGVALGPVITQSREFAVTSEMKQIELSIENFKNKYGFYPPSFSALGATVTTDPLDVDASNGSVPAGDENALLPYLNKMSPNHRELSPMFGTTGPSRLRVWWVAIGRHLDDRGSLVFWLNGLSKNKQFPITGGLPLASSGNAQLPVIFNSDLAIQVDASSVRQTGEVAIEGVFERDVLFDFRGGQLSSQYFNYIVPTPGLLDIPAGIRAYNSPYGNQKFDLAYRYRNGGFYDRPGVIADAYHVNTDGGQVFLNPGTFQLSTLGLDGQVSTFATTAINKPSTGTAAQREEWLKNNDNITNFAEGRLDAFDWPEAVELGGANPL